MNNNYLAKKILKYYPVKEYANFARVCRAWQDAVSDAMFSLPCDKCHKTNKRTWRRFIKQRPYWNLFCEDCVQDEAGQIWKYRGSFGIGNFFPAIPLLPGSTNEFWVTTDIPTPWLLLWKELPVY